MNTRAVVVAGMIGFLFAGMCATCALMTVDIDVMAYISSCQVVP